MRKALSILIKLIVLGRNGLIFRTLTLVLELMGAQQQNAKI